LDRMNDRWKVGSSDASLNNAGCDPRDDGSPKL
jgi:hypothetical protein